MTIGIMKSWLILTNATMMLSWARVLLNLFMAGPNDILDSEQTICKEYITSSVTLALSISFLELLNSLIGATRSKPAPVLLFSVIRFGVEVIVTPAMEQGCSSWLHIVTVSCWSLGDTIRFGCFLVDNIVPGGSYLAKAMRYSVAPVLFPIGALGEMLMVISVGNLATSTVNKLLIYGAALLWPVGFGTLFLQLLKQRRKFFSGPQKVKV